MDHLFLNEISRNVDGYRLSTFFHKEKDSKGGKIRMGPVWDYDLAWYNADYCDGFSTTGWAYNINYVCADAGVPFWWERLMQDTLFNQDMACRWRALRSSVLGKDAIFGKIDSMASLLHESQARNFKNWPTLGIYVWPNPGPLPTTYEGEIDKLKNWITQRLAWLDGAFGQYLPALSSAFTAQANTALEWTFTASAPAVYQYNWDFGDGSFSSEQSPTHQYSGFGNYTVRLQITSSFGCGDASQQVIHLVNTATSEPAGNTMTLTPNPASGKVRLTLPDGITFPCTVSCSSETGQIVLEKRLEGTAHWLDLEVSGLPAAIYGIYATDGVNRYYSRLMVR
jgi:hypothetical protein